MVVEYLNKELAAMVPMEVRCFGNQDVREPDGQGYAPWAEAKQNTDPRFGGALDAACRGASASAKDNLDADVVHVHTWYVSLRASWRRSCGACRWYSPRTRWNRSDRGKWSSSATPIT